MIEKGAVFPMFYLPPIEYFINLKTYRPDILIEREEHFPKQTYRNRANVYTPDGVLALVVPVIKGSKNHTKVKDVKISYDFNWQRLHWLSLQACYRRSSYFEYYEADFAPFYENRYDFLFDFNEQLLNLALKLLKLKTELKFTQSYQEHYANMADFRLTM